MDLSKNHAPLLDSPKTSPSRNARHCPQTPRRVTWTTLLCTGMLALLAGCSAAGSTGRPAAGGGSPPTGQRSAETAPAESPRAESANPRSAAPASPRRREGSVSACSSRALLDEVRRNTENPSQRAVIVRVEIARCRNGYAHVFAIPRTGPSGHATAEGEQFFLRYRHGAWSNVATGTGISCADPDAGRSLLGACTALGYGTAAHPARITNPQVVADRLLRAWMRHDTVAAGRLVSNVATMEALFSEEAPTSAPETIPCRPAGLGLFACSYTLSSHAELTVVVGGGASAGYGVTGVEWGD
jgi:hypothetical protein